MSWFVAGLSRLSSSTYLEDLRMERLGPSWRAHTISVCSVRDWLDLEHGRVYRQDIHWNALVGHLAAPGCRLWKYIYNALNGSEQLFCLSRDPNETVDLASTEVEVLVEWRSRMVDQFEREQRGQEWVWQGTLRTRINSTLFGPHYPCHPKSAVRLSTQM